ncbi:MAG: DUF5718 family protein [Solirubrobacterales bacterium]
MQLVAISDDDLRDSFGIGVAGNFAGHLEQAGEDRDFIAVAASPAAPKGIFPFYARAATNYLADYPISSTRIAWTTVGDLQIEPELAVICSIDYDATGLATSLKPQTAAAFNDCSARRPNADKISEKKNWGADSKGLAARGFAVDEIERDGATSSLRLACFLRRNSTVSTYGVDSAVADYSYYGAQLLDWIVDRLRLQRDEAGSPLEDVGALLAACGLPTSIVIGIGATRYTPFGESNFLRPGDQSIVVAYDSGAHSAQAIRSAVVAGDESALDDASVLSQVVG